MNYGSGHSGFRWIVEPEQVFGPALALYEAAIREGIRAILQRRAPEIANWMKENAPWTDRTGNARQGLHTELEALAYEMTLILAHGVQYGLPLELRNAGRYAIIGPALDEWAPIIWQDVKELMR